MPHPDGRCLQDRAAAPRTELLWADPTPFVQYSSPTPACAVHPFFTPPGDKSAESLGLRAPCKRISRSRRFHRAASNRRWPGVLYLLAVLTLFAATTVVSNARFQFGETDLVFNADLGSGLDAWRSRGTGRATLDPADVPSVRLTHTSGHGDTAVYREFAPDGTLTHLRVSVEARTRQVAKGPKPWNMARLVAAPFDADGAFIPGRPHVLFSETGTRGWRRYDGIFPVGPDVATLKTELQLLQAAGSVGIRNLRVLEASAVPALARVHRMLGVCWAGAIVIALVWLLRHLPKHGLWVCGALTVAVIVLTAPRPQDHVVRPVLLDRFIDAALIAPYLPDFLAPPARPVPPVNVAVPDTAAPPPDAEQRSTLVAAATGAWLKVVDVVRRFDHLDEYMHATLLFAVSIFCVGMAGQGALGLIGAALLVLALISEFLQVFSLGRSFSLGDAGYNLLGVAAGVIVFLATRRLVLLGRPARRFGHRT